MNVTLWPINKIRPYARNARQIPQKAVDKVAASIHEFGWRQPIVVDSEGVIVCGHTRLLAAQKLGLKEVPVHVAENLTSAQIRAYRLLDNRSHQETTWDHELLGLELFDLREMGIDLNLNGFDMGEIDALLAGDGLTDPDTVPEIPETPVSAPGDLWILGNHRLLCGDSTASVSFNRLLDGSLAGMVFTDPPYNVDYRQSEGRLAGRRVANDNLGVAFEGFLSDVCRNLLEVTKGAIYICMSSSELGALKRVFADEGGHWSTFLIWAKNTFTLGRSDYQRQYEPILYGWKQGQRATLVRGQEPRRCVVHEQAGNQRPASHHEASGTSGAGDHQ